MQENCENRPRKHCTNKTRNKILYIKKQKKSTCNTRNALLLQIQPQKIGRHIGRHSHKQKLRRSGLQTYTRFGMEMKIEKK